MVLNESQKVLEKISAETLYLPDVNNDTCSTITDTTDVLLQVKPYLPLTTKASISKIGNYRPNHHRKNLKPKEVKEPKINPPLSDINSLDDTKTDKDISTCSDNTLLRNEMTIKLQKLQERNKILRQMLYSKSTRCNNNLHVTIESRTGDSMNSTTNTFVKPETHKKDSNVLTSTFANSPNIFLASLSSIRSTDTTDPLHGSMLEFLNNNKSESSSTGKLLENIENTEHKLYLDKLLKDIEDSSSSILTTPLFDVQSLAGHQQESTTMKQLPGKVIEDLFVLVMLC